LKEEPDKGINDAGIEACLVAGLLLWQTNEFSIAALGEDYFTVARPTHLLTGESYESITSEQSPTKYSRHCAVEFSADRFYPLTATFIFCISTHVNSQLRRQAVIQKLLGTHLLGYRCHFLAYRLPATQWKPASNGMYCKWPALKPQRKNTSSWIGTIRLRI
jgi:hypothetical protein